MTRREREVRDPEQIRGILERSQVIHLGLVDEGMPYVVPMNYGYQMENGKLTIYLHGSRNGYKLDVIRKNPTCCFEMSCDLRPFTGDVACKYGISYKSLMGRGAITVVEDPEEKMKGLSLLMKAQTGKDFGFTEKLASVVTVYRIDVSEYTGKYRPLPEDKNPD